ncbi:MAG: hypothetical protein AAF211_02155 [Myxococcota bacterium]
MNRNSLIVFLAMGCTGSSTDAETGTPPDPPDATGDTAAPAFVDCPDGPCVVEGPITADRTFFADNAYLLLGTVVVGNDADEVTLTIEAGATVLGDVDTQGTLVVSRHADIVAEGTAESPIVMTSSAMPGTRARGDWGGLVLNGRAQTNGAGTAETGPYGGTTDDDDSGVLRYVRIEFSGAELLPDEPVPGLRLNAVGSRTRIDHVQIHRGQGDGFGILGGTVDLRYVVASQAGDDGFDWADGWTGRAQWVVVQSPQNEESGSPGIEGGNLASEPRVGPPFSAPILANVTLVGDPETTREPVGIFLRHGTRGEVWNTLVSDFRGACLDIDGAVTWEGVDTGAIDVRGSRFACPAVAVVDDQDLTDDGMFDPADPIDLVAWFSEPARGNTNPLTLDWLGEPRSATSPVFGSTETGAVPGPTDTFFDETDIVGAIGTDAWTAGWTAYPVN